MYMILLALNLIIFSIVYNLFFKKDKFRKELDSIRKEKILSKPKQQTNENILFSFTPSTSELINYLNKIIKDNNTEIVKKYFYSFTVFINMQKFLFAIMVLFSCGEITAQDFNGSWGTDQSNYYLTIKNKEFISYKFVPYEDEDGCISWKKVYSPGIEEFLKKEDNVIVTNYWVDENKYYVKVTYTLVGDNDLSAEFNGKLKGDFYYKVVNYKRMKLESRI